MFTVDRHRRLLQHLRVDGPSNVVELAEALGVSPSTVRRDLRTMDEHGLVHRMHGGASAAAAAAGEFLIAARDPRRRQATRMGAAAAQFVADNSTVLITGGPATAAIVPHLAGRHGLTVLTNGLEIAWHLVHEPAVTVVVLGGLLRDYELHLASPAAERTLADFRVDVAFFSAFGIDAAGVSSDRLSEAATDRQLLRCAESRVALMDATSFGRRGPVRLVDIEELSCLVTDDDAPGPELATIRERGVAVVVC